MAELANRQTGVKPRFVVDELGPRDFAVRDTVTQLSYDICFTRKVAQEAAARRNGTVPREETAAEVRRADRDYWVDRDWDGDYDDPSDHYYC